MKNYEADLPESYKEIYSIDAKNIKTGVLLNVIALIIAAAVIVPLVILLLRNTEDALSMVMIPELFPALIALSVGSILYMVLHELTHGAAYYILTRRKLTFGISFTVAFCGVPDIYVHRKAFFIATVAPFVLFSIIFILGIIFMPTLIWRLFAAVMLGLHVAGCVGDLYNAILLLFRFRGNVLVKDTGPRQTFYSDCI